MVAGDELDRGICRSVGFSIDVNHGTRRSGTDEEFAEPGRQKQVHCDFIGHSRRHGDRHGCLVHIIVLNDNGFYGMVSGRNIPYNCWRDLGLLFTIDMDDGIVEWCALEK